MKRDWIFDIYRRVKVARTKELERVIAILRPKAAADPDIQEALRVLELWKRGENNLGDLSPKAKDDTKARF